jgi:hypothetical protein
MQRYYEEGNEGKPRCRYACFVRETKCVCEGLLGHEGEHERVTTLFCTTAEDLMSLPRLKSFKQVNQSE